MELFAPMDCVMGLQLVSVDIEIHVITVTNECVWDRLNLWQPSLILYSNFSPYATSSVNIRFSSFVFQISLTHTMALSGGQCWNSVIGAVNPPSNWTLIWKSVNQTSSICVDNHPISSYQAWSNFRWRSWGNSIYITGRKWHSYFPSLLQVGLSCFVDLYDMHILWIDFCRFTMWIIVCDNFFPFYSPGSKYRAPGVCLHLRFKLDIKGNCCPVCGSNCTTAGKLTRSVVDDLPPVSTLYTLFWGHGLLQHDCWISCIERNIWHQQDFIHQLRQPISGALLAKWFNSPAGGLGYLS